MGTARLRGSCGVSLLDETENPLRVRCRTPQKQKVSDMSDKCPLSCRAYSRHIRLSRDVAGLPEPKFAVSEGFQTVIRLVQGGEEPSGKTSGLILEMIRQQPEITMPEMTEALGKSTPAIELQLAKLKTSGKVQRISPAKGGRRETDESRDEWRRRARDLHADAGRHLLPGDA